MKLHIQSTPVTFMHTGKWNNGTIFLPSKRSVKGAEPTDFSAYILIHFLLCLKMLVRLKPNNRPLVVHQGQTNQTNP